MKIQKHNLSFIKKNIIELNAHCLSKVIGGTGTGGISPSISKITDILNYSKNTFCNSDAN